MATRQRNHTGIWKEKREGHVSGGLKAEEYTSIVVILCLFVEGIFTLIYFKPQNIYSNIIVPSSQLENKENWKIGVNFLPLLSEGISESAFLKDMIHCMQSKYMNICSSILWIFLLQGYIN